MDSFDRGSSPQKKQALRKSEKSMVTLKDIAAEAGVSITTVSNVVHNRKSRVSPEMVEKIEAIIAREHYAPSMSARSLANDQSNIIGVISHITPQNPGSTIGDPFMSSFVDSPSAFFFFFLDLFLFHNILDIFFLHLSLVYQ